MPGQDCFPSVAVAERIARDREPAGRLLNPRDEYSTFFGRAVGGHRRPVDSMPGYAVYRRRRLDGAE